MARTDTKLKKHPEFENWVNRGEKVEAFINAENRSIFCKPEGGPDFSVEAELVVNAVRALAKRDAFNEHECRRMIEELSNNYKHVNKRKH